MAAVDRRPVVLFILVAAVVAVGIAVVSADRDASPGDAGTASESLAADRAPENARGAVAAPGGDAASAGPTDRDSSLASGVGALAGDGSSASLGIADPNRVPIPIPLEFIEIFERNESLAEFHAMLEGEVEDTAWALALEQFIQSQLDASLDLSEFRVLSIECRSSACEVLGMGYGETAVRGWMEGMFGLVEDEDAFEALIGGPGQMGCGFDELAPGVTAMNCTMQRTDPEAEEPAAEEWLSLEAPYPDDVLVERVGVPDAIVPAIEFNPGAYELHRRLELELVDYSWATYNEPLIAEYLGQLGPQGVDVLGVVCRSTLCEVQLQVRDEAAELDLMPYVIDFHRLDWHQLGTAGMDRADVEEGDPIGIVWFLERVPQN